MISPRVLSLLCVFVVGSVVAAEHPTEPMRLWAGKAPDALGDAPKDIPTLTPYWPADDQASGAAFIVCPGGGYRNLAAHEGEPFAKWLNSLGIAAFVLKYRLTTDGYFVPTTLLDAARALRTVRAHATEWGIDPKRIGMIGSSAGGHLTATLITQFDNGKPDDADPVERVSSRPDLAVLCYGFILFDQPNPEREARFLGAHATPELKNLLSPRLNVRKDTPTTFIWQTVEDEKVPVDNAFAFADAMREKGVPFDLHLYQKGKHGIGLGFKTFDPEKLHPWTRDCAFWLKEHGFMK
ncbi:alpha/beta hydrolase [Chthoniobacter flavus Ellin428]|uniref:Alpha/beta hydrolase n=1 Tax=Chthoniobacter flavus Ellin428 TaxID=497964 RepID=B4CWZ1_9BACT|nr:alpha/beta hydrolase [Chthoniobacter flavus]EDY21311.1 alpha/beta hydrolase [Chthoniobacter flavus Ellin428]TCO84920.1 acetyl esterase/lipase [Chthoniobacter flavus]